jgi:hypothetical protein
MPVGLVTPDDLERIAAAARKFSIPVIKIASVQRFALVGIERDAVDAVWQELGMDVGKATELCLHYVQACPGTDLCEFGSHDSTGLGKKIEEFFVDMDLRAKVKIGRRFGMKSRFGLPLLAFAALVLVAFGSGCRDQVAAQSSSGTGEQTAPRAPTGPATSAASSTRGQDAAGHAHDPAHSPIRVGLDLGKSVECLPMATMIIGASMRQRDPELDQFCIVRPG